MAQTQIRRTDAVKVTQRMDRMTKAQRSHSMQRVRSQDTEPEMILRSSLHRSGYRYRLHDKTLPGTPDIVFSKRRRAIFVHGCFWHSHHCPRGARPSSNASFWDKKLDANRRRDARNIRQLTDLGWQTLILWECEVRANKVLEKAQAFLDR